MANLGTPTHAAFSDESSWNSGRYRSISLITMPLRHRDALEKSLQNSMAGCAAAELKWTGRWSYAKIAAAQCALDVLASEVGRGRLRLDVLTWDIEDSRHAVEGRDDRLNLAIMYYHLCRNVFRSRWGSTAVWRLFPDRHSGIDWHELEEILGTGAPTSVSCFANNLAQLPRYRVAEIRPVVAREHRLTQTCDLLAGAVAFSWEEYGEYRDWRRRQLHTLFPTASILRHNRSHESRFELIRHIEDKWPRWLAVDAHGLRTKNPALPVNFWLYRPQHRRDRAPARGPGGRIRRARDPDPATRPK